MEVVGTRVAAAGTSESHAFTKECVRHADGFRSSSALQPVAEVGGKGVDGAERADDIDLRAVLRRQPQCTLGDVAPGIARTGQERSARVNLHGGQ
jgi:hypothetical protein